MTVGDGAITGSGVEYIVDVYGCNPDLLRSFERLEVIVTRLIGEVGDPETRFAAISLYCCGAPRDWPWETRLRAWFEADRVDVQTLDRGSRLPSDRLRPALIATS